MSILPMGIRLGSNGATIFFTIEFTANITVWYCLASMNIEKNMMQQPWKHHAQQNHHGILRIYNSIS